MRPKKPNQVFWIAAILVAFLVLPVVGMAKEAIQGDVLADGLPIILPTPERAIDMLGGPREKHLPIPGWVGDKSLSKEIPLPANGKELLKEGKNK